MRVAVTGASGLIGSALVPALRGDGHDVVRFVRGTASGPDDRPWDPARASLDPALLEDVDAVVHLAGAGVADKRWTARHKADILRSRVDGTTAVANAIAASGHPTVLLSASAVGWYGDTGDRSPTRQAPPATGSSPTSSGSGRPRPLRRKRPAYGPRTCAPASSSPEREARCGSRPVSRGSASAPRWAAAGSGSAGSRSPTRSARSGTS